jgi:hypothetical protein
MYYPSIQYLFTWTILFKTSFLHLLSHGQTKQKQKKKTSTDLANKYHPSNSPSSQVKMKWVKFRVVKKKANYKMRWDNKTSLSCNGMDRAKPMKVNLSQQARDKLTKLSSYLLRYMSSCHVISLDESRKDDSWQDEMTRTNDAIMYIFINMYLFLPYFFSLAKKVTVWDWIRDHGSSAWLLTMKHYK